MSVSIKRSPVDVDWIRIKKGRQIPSSTKHPLIFLQPNFPNNLLSYSVPTADSISKRKLKEKSFGRPQTFSRVVTNQKCCSSSSSH